MKKILFTLGIASLLCSCSPRYDYADEMIEIYEDAVNDFEDAESMDELISLREAMRQQCEEVEKEELESHQALIKAVEDLDEDAYLIHLSILYAESHAQWMYHKKEIELK